MTETQEYYEERSNAELIDIIGKQELRIAELEEEIEKTMSESIELSKQLLAEQNNSKLQAGQIAQLNALLSAQARVAATVQSSLDAASRAFSLWPVVPGEQQQRRGK